MKKIIYAFFSAFVALNMLFVTTALARPYGCGLYNAQTYDNGTCTSSSPSPSPTPPTSASTKKSSSTTKNSSSTTTSNPSQQSPVDNSNNNPSDTEEPSTFPNSSGTLTPPSSTTKSNKLKIGSTALPVSAAQAIEILLGLALITGAIWLIVWYRKRDKKIVPTYPTQTSPPVNTPTVWG